MEPRRARAGFPDGPKVPAAAAGLLSGGGLFEGRFDTTICVEGVVLEVFKGGIFLFVKGATIWAGLFSTRGWATLSGGAILMGGTLFMGGFFIAFIDLIKLAFGFVIAPPLTGYKLTGRGIRGIDLRSNPPEVGTNPT